MCAIKEVRVISDDQASKECLKQLNQVCLSYFLQKRRIASALCGCFLFFIEPILIFVSKTLNWKHHDIGIRFVTHSTCVNRR